MFVFCLVFVYMSIYNVSEGRRVQAMIGSNVSFSFTLTNITNDIFILHKTSLFMSVWPAKKFYAVHNELETVRVSVDMSSRETIIITISLLNITKKNAGIYTVAQPRESEKFNDSFLLQAIEGRTLQAVVGRSVSFSFALSNLTTGAVFILHDMSLFFSMWPSKNVSVPHQDPEKVPVTVDMLWGKSSIVTLSFLNITKKDGGIYTVTQQLNSDEFIDCVLLETIDDAMIPRVVIVHHLDLDLSLVLQCLTNSSYSGNFMWKLNASLIKEYDRYSQNNAYLSIRNLTADDQYNSYTCSEQEIGLESDPFRLKAVGPTFVNFTPKKAEIKENNSLNVSCISDCNPICTCQWTKFDRTLGIETDVSAKIALYFSNITRQDAGEYKCTVQNVISGTSYTSVLPVDVIYGPDAILLNASNAFIEMDEFQSVTISCSSNCFPPCQIQWSHSNKLMPGADLRLSNLQNGGNFTCHAVNERNVNTSISKTISITLKSGTGIYSTTAMDVINDAEATGTSYTSAADTTREATSYKEELRVNRLLLYLVIVMSVLLVTGVCICILRKFVKCPCLDRVPDSIQFQDGGEENPLQENPLEGYWTIVCNAEGNLSTELDTNISKSNEQTPFACVTVTEVKKWEASPQFRRKEVGMELDGYIHAIHSDPVNTGFMTTCDKTEV